MKTHNALIVLKALLMGIQINGKDGQTYCISINDEFGTKITTSQQEELLMIQDWSLNWFIKFANQLSNEEIALLAAQITLNS